MANTQVSARAIDTSGDAQELPAEDTLEDVWEAPEGDIVTVHFGMEATEGKVLYQVDNDGETDLRLVGARFGISEGGENNRGWLQVGFKNLGIGNGGVQNRIISNLGSPPGGQYSRGSSTDFLPEAVRPRFRSEQSCYAMVDLSNPNNTDTTKAYFQLYFTVESENRL